MNLRQKLTGVVQLFRPELPAAAGMCVVLGEVLALRAWPSLPMLGLGFACGFFLSGSALIVNDYFDFEVDQVNAPHRPLPSGRLTRAEVMALGLAAALAGLAAAGAFGWLAFGVSLIVWLMGFLYNWKLKAAGLWGNAIVGASVGMTFILGGMVAGQAWNRTVWLFGLIAFVFDLAEEIAADAMDAEGDLKRGSQSVAIVWGRPLALRISALLFGLVVVLSWLPYAWHALGVSYLLPILVMDSLITVFVVKLLTSRTSAEGRWAIRALYLSASLGLLAFLVGTFFT
jgi:geranylgeranylglycerol-phosphate geranylgeranyltransferase